MTTTTGVRVARVNGLPLHADGERLTAEALRQRACAELLRQAAQRAGHLAADDLTGPDGVQSEAASRAIEQLLERTLSGPKPDDAACRRHFEATAAQWRRGERVRLRHILFAVTPGVDVRALRSRAEATLLEVRCDLPSEGDGAFARQARALSNCPSGVYGGNLDWLTASACAPEFAREIFGRSEVGVLPRLVHTRFGLHVVEVLAREPGELPPYATVRDAVAQRLRNAAWVRALRQYLQLLARDALLEGVELDAAESPLVQ